MAKEVRIVVRGIRRAEPDIEKLARALVQYALAAQKASTVEAEPEPPATNAEAEP
ncbi:MAG TPA: hypothetical protein VME46_23255 [Acidimicrobiales bacterium]|nr:hypothetical protein [Acidimicrobiales bacterium]